MNGTRILAAWALMAALAACTPQAQQQQQQSAPEAATPSREALIERGTYLVVLVAGCNDCHTPMTPDGRGPDMMRQLIGADLSFAPTNPQQPWAPYAPPLAGLPEGYTQEQLTNFLQTGYRPSGVPVSPPMPAYRFNPEDAEAVVAYIMSLPKPGDAAPATPSAP